MTVAGATLHDAARRHRRAVSGVIFVAVTGSCGKTTTKDLIAQVLGERFRGSKNEIDQNCGPQVARNVLAVRPGDDFFVQELGAWGPGTLDAGIEAVRPDVAVVTNVRNDHYSAFRGPLGALAEKGKLVTSLAAGGTAVLNWDDPHVRGLARSTAAATLSFGRAADAALRAEDAVSRWPETLTFTAVHRGQRARVRTRLLGEHLLPSALAAMAVGLLFGMGLEEVAAGLARAEPTPRRMSPVTGPDGVTFVRDDYKAPADSVPEVLAFMRAARAARRLAVLGRVADFPGRSRPTYTRIAWQALAALDAVLFVGDRAVELWGEQTSAAPGDQERLRRLLQPAQEPVPESPGQLFVLPTVAAADRFLRGHLRAGDLVLLKGSGPADHLERLVLGRERAVTCWLHACGRDDACDGCPLLRE